MNRKSRRAERRKSPRRAGEPAGAGVPGAEATIRAALRSHQSGRLDEAVALYRRAIEAAPGHPVALHYLGVLELQRGRAGEAVELIGKAVAARPGDATARYNHGTALQAAGELRSAAAAFREAAKLAPGNADAEIGLGNALQGLARWEEAAAAFGRAIAIRPDAPEAHNNLGIVHQVLGRLVEATAAYARALELRPGYADAYANLGNVYKAQGRLADAIAAYERALELDPALAEALSNLVGIKDIAPDDPLLARLERLAEAGSLPPESAVSLHFARARIHDKLGRADEAFAAYRRGNELRGNLDRRAGIGFDADVHERLVERLIEAFTPAFFAARQGFGIASEVPVFVLGMPRSGTTLVEQIVASHAEVFGAGELPYLGQVAGRAYPENLTDLDQAGARRPAESYLEQLCGHAPEARHITDKMPTNFLLIAAIALLLPKARIIHCRRDPLDTCVSCYTQNFRTGNVFATELTDLGRYYRAYERLMAHWRAATPVRLLDVRYEELVADPEEVSRAMVGFLGLEWDPNCLDFHRNPRAVATASSVQVRQPIYRSALARWRRYEDHLGPLIAALDRPGAGA